MAILQTYTSLLLLTGAVRGDHARALPTVYIVQYRCYRKKAGKTENERTSMNGCKGAEEQAPSESLLSRGQLVPMPMVT